MSASPKQCAKCLAFARFGATDEELRAAGWRTLERSSGYVSWFCPRPECDPNAPAVVVTRKKRR